MIRLLISLRFTMWSNDAATKPLAPVAHAVKLVIARDDFIAWLLYDQWLFCRLNV